MPRPNILYIHSHDTGRYVQPYGWGNATPNLQRLAEEGVLFAQAFSMAPTCTPSRAALLTGQAPHSAGVYGLINRGFSGPDYSRHIVHTLRAVGYETVLCGVQHLAADVRRIGYDRVLPVRSGRAVDVAPAAVEFLRSRPAQPWFLSVGFVETHREDAGGFISDEAADTAAGARGIRPPLPLPDTPTTRTDMLRFHASAAVLDKGIGMVLDALDEAGLADETLVICTTDHGIAFPGMKCNLTDHGIGVMLIVRGPGGFRGGRVCDALVSHVDIFPTVCDLLQIEPPEWLQGCSMLPLVNGDAEEIHEAIYAEINYHCAYEPVRAVRTRRWKYIRRFHDYPHPILCNCDDSPSKQFWIECGWGRRPVRREELYDLMFDPVESCNLVDAPAVQGVLAEMRNRLEQWMSATDDPLLNGPVPKPERAVVNDPTDVGPKDVWQRIPRPEGFS